MAGRKITVAEMVTDTVSKLKAARQVKGASLYAIKLSIALVYQVDVNKQAHLIRKALMKAVDAGTLIKVSGSGANGSYKLAPKKQPVARRSPKAKKAVAALREPKGVAEKGDKVDVNLKMEMAPEAAGKTSYQSARMRASKYPTGTGQGEDTQQQDMMPRLIKQERM